MEVPEWPFIFTMIILKILELVYHIKRTLKKKHFIVWDSVQIQKHIKIQTLTKFKEIL